jgi:hypothetical protein
MFEPQRPGRSGTPTGILVVVLFVVAFQVRRAREHQVAQAVEVVEDAVGVGFGEIQVLLSASGRDGAMASTDWGGAVRRRAQGQIGYRSGRIVLEVIVRHIPGQVARRPLSSNLTERELASLISAYLARASGAWPDVARGNPFLIIHESAIIHVL